MERDYRNVGIRQKPHSDSPTYLTNGTVSRFHFSTAPLLLLLGLLLHELFYRIPRFIGDSIEQESIGSALEGYMFCQSCGSVNLDKFSAETGIRRLGLKNIDKPAVFVFSELIVCLDCGRAEFVVPKTELRLLPQRNAFAA